MSTGAVTASIDVAQLVLYGFWIFFAGLVYYLHRENKREGYPLVADGASSGRYPIQGFPPVPEPKTYLLRDGRTRQIPPGVGGDQGGWSGEPMQQYPGSPIVPVGNPLRAGVGPGAYAGREDVPDITLDGAPRIVPMRTLTDFGVSPGDIDPRGLPVRGADRNLAGKIVDLWVDRSEMHFRFYEVELPDSSRVLLPVHFADVKWHEVRVDALLALQFAGVPTTRKPDQITLLEEERITAYFGAGTLYAEPSRAEPWI